MRTGQTALCCAFLTGCLLSCVYTCRVYFASIFFHSIQLFTKLDCDEVAILEHTEQLLQELGKDTSQVAKSELKSKGEGEETGPEDSDSELLEEDAQATKTMELS